jgi:hypothetical protein
VVGAAHVALRGGLLSLGDGHGVLLFYFFVRLAKLERIIGFVRLRAFEARRISAGDGRLGLSASSVSSLGLVLPPDMKRRSASNGCGWLGSSVELPGELGGWLRRDAPSDELGARGIPAHDSEHKGKLGSSKTIASRTNASRTTVSPSYSS